MSETTDYSVHLAEEIKEQTENCRMCLESQGEFVSLDNTFEFSSDNSTYWDAYNFCTNLNAQPTDCLPKILCIECAGNLEFSFDVIKKATLSDQVLRQVLEKQLVIESVTKDCAELDEQQVLRDLTEESTQQDEYKSEQNDDSCDDNEMEELIYLEETSRISGDEDVLNVDQNEFVCVICEVVFAAKEELEQHFIIHEKVSSDQILSDDGPIEAFQDEDSIIEPPKGSSKRLKRKDSKNTICEVCGKCFSSNQKLKVHTLVHTKEKNFPCNLCPKRYSTIFRHREHMRMHANIRPHECKTCKQKFFSKHALVCHMRRHTGERPYKCEICGKTFAQNSVMKTHKALHTGKTVECPHCFKKFSRPSHLILHQRSHTGERPYVCHLCPNSYKQKSHLDRHLDTHLGVKHPCDICGKEYSKKSSLNMHKSVHSNIKPIKCDLCSREFATKDRYRRHLRNSHKTKIKDESADDNIDKLKLEDEAADDPGQLIFS